LRAASLSFDIALSLLSFRGDAQASDYDVQLHIGES